MDEVTRERKRSELAEASRLFDLPPPERAARLAELEAVDRELAAELRALLDCADDVHATGVEVDDSPGSRVGQVVSGRFRLVCLLGSGGMGEVYLAERTDEVDRKVALKLMRTDLPVPIERARRERQILARLIHPNIAGLVDAGLADFGQPWFAMDFIDGETITAWCDHHALVLRARTRMMAQVCRAVQFAHRNLVLHRDIKPSNILVDDEGVPKLLDFGIAKLLDVTDARQTQTLALTPAYAAPEQLRGDPATTASDVYQLGLVLYELLAGISARKARESSSPRARLETPLPRVDQAVATQATRDPGTAERIAHERGLGVDKLRRSLKGDLARIVAKATAEDVQERYATAQALADDLDRWAEGLPVAAHRGSFGYRASKFVRRHAVASVALTVLASGLIAVSVVAVRQSSRDRAQREHAETLLNFMQDIFRQADPQNAKGADLSAAELLTRAADGLDDRKDIDPQTLAILKTRVADTFNSLMKPGQALSSATQALALLEPTRTAQPATYLETAVVLLDTLQYLDRAAEQRDWVDRLRPTAALAGTAAAEWKGRLSMYRGDADCKLGDFARCTVDLQSAISELKGLSTSQAESSLAESLNLLNRLKTDQGDALESRRLITRSIGIESVSALSRQNLAVYRHNLAVSLYSLGEYRPAMDLLTPLLGELPAYSGAEGRTAAARVSLLIGRTHAALGEYDKARSILAAVEAEAVAIPVSDARFLVGIEFAAAKFAVDTGDVDEARTHIERALAILAEEGRGLGFLALRVRWLQSEIMVRAGRCDEARPALLEARSNAMDANGSVPGWTLGEIEDSLGRCELARGDPSAARVRFAQAITQFRAATGAGSPSTLRSEIHSLWADSLATRDPSDIRELDARRTQLVATLGGDRVLPVWQLDLLIDGLARTSGLGPAAAGRAEEGASRIAALAGRFAPVLVANGINSFD